MVSTLLPRRGGGESPRSAERNSPLRFSKKDCRPDRVNRPRGQVPRWVGAEKEPPIKGEHANAVRMPRRVSAKKKREPSHEGSLKNQFFRFRKYPRYITAAAMLQKYAIIYGTSKIFSK